jgi:hypothetical protein
MRDLQRPQLALAERTPLEEFGLDLGAPNVLTQIATRAPREMSCRAVSNPMP